MANVAKSSSPVFSNTSKSSTQTFKNVLRKAADPRLDSLENYTFEDTPFMDRDEKLKDQTFAELQPTSWSNISKS